MSAVALPETRTGRADPRGTPGVSYFTSLALASPPFDPLDALLHGPAMRALLLLFITVSACADKAQPVRVDPADLADLPDNGDLEDLFGPDLDPEEVTDTARPDVPLGATPSGGLWVFDAAGTPVGLLVRRGSDDATAGRAIYDFVTVYHPESDLFFEITMTDGAVRLPPNTFFAGFSCDTPVGIGVGACTECRAAHSLGFLHGGRWWRLRDGAAFQTMGPGSVMKGGLATECVAHGTANAKLFPVDAVSGTTPPTSFSAPLRFAVR